MFRLYPEYTISKQGYSIPVPLIQVVRQTKHISCVVYRQLGVCPWQLPPEVGKGSEEASFDLTVYSCQDLPMLSSDNSLLRERKNS